MAQMTQMEMPSWSGLSVTSASSVDELGSGLPLALLRRALQRQPRIALFPPSPRLVTASGFSRSIAHVRAYLRWRNPPP